MASKHSRERRPQIEHLSREVIRAVELFERLDQATLAKAFRGELFEKAS